MQTSCVPIQIELNYQQQYHLLVFQSDKITEQHFRPECDHRQAISVHKNTVAY